MFPCFHYRGSEEERSKAKTRLLITVNSIVVTTGDNDSTMTNQSPMTTGQGRAAEQFGIKGEKCQIKHTGLQHLPQNKTGA